MWRVVPLHAQLHEQYTDSSEVSSSFCGLSEQPNPRIRARAGPPKVEA
jgi:hypothetical protein